MHSTNMFKNYIFRFTLRLCVLLTVAAVWFFDRTALDFTQNTRLLHPLNLLWLLFFLSFALQLSPTSRVSRGCLKQFPAHFHKIEAAVDELRVKTQLRRLDLGATRVAIAWLLLNGIFAALYFLGILAVPEMLLLASFYYVCDLVCIIFYCPFQHLFMKNKCCVTCRIFAWGTIMIATPLLFVPHFYSWSLVALALICTLLWEMRYRRYPTHFLEETNAFLACENCTDRLCLIKRRAKYMKK